MIFRSLISLFFVLILSIIVLTNTNIGLTILFKAVPGKVTAKQISATLLHGGTIKNLSYQYQDFSLSINEINFQWEWRALLKQKLVINKVKIRKMKINLSESSNNNSNIELAPIHLPFDIYLNQISIDHADIHKKKSTFLINSVSLTGKAVNDFITLDQFLVVTPDFSTSTQGTVNLNAWSNISFKNKFVLNARPEIPVFTNIIGNKHIINLNIKSVKWLNINLILQNYLQPAKQITLKSDWFIDTTKAEFPELKKLKGKLQFSGHANGQLLQPNIDGNLLAENLRYETTLIKKLNSRFQFTLDDQQKIAFTLSGKNISLGETIINNIKTSISGTVKSHKINTTLQMLDSYFFSFTTQAGFVNNNYFFKQGKFYIAPLNITLNPINLNIHFEKNKTAMYDAKLQNNNEILTLQGTIKYAFSNFEAHTSIASNQFTLIDTDSYKIIVSPTLLLDHENNKTVVSGSLNIINATISPIDLSNTVTPTNDIVYVNNQNKPLYPKAEPLKLFIDVMIKIKKLIINYKGINADISGETKLTQTPATELNAYGQLQILRGSYKAYGQMLTIQKNSVINFNREINNPQLNITASKEIKVSPEYMTLPSYQPYLIAGVQVTGTADSPNIHLFSVPSGVNQQDILSYLIFGFPQNQLSKSQTSALWNAFNMIDTGNSNFSLTNLQKSIQNEFGFSEFGLGSTSEFNAGTQQYESGTAFVVGKRITDNLTATYNVGLLVPVNVLYLRYQLSKHWALQSDSSALGNGGDIFYTIRRD